MTCQTARLMMATVVLDTDPVRDAVFGHIFSCPYCSEWRAAGSARRGVALKLVDDLPTGNVRIVE